MVSREDDRFPIEITRVVDGDGFQAKVLDGSNRTIDVRLYAIDAPEGRQKYGREATNHLRQEVKNGRFWLQSKGQDPNGRTVAIVYKDSFDSSQSLNYVMVRSGWAYWYSHYEDGENELELREAEATAYMEGKGVWQEPDLERPWDYKERILQEKNTARFNANIEADIRDSLQEAAAVGNAGWTELHAATSLGYAPIVQKLLANGFNADLRDSVGQTPLHVAGFYAVVEILLRAGATVNVEDVEGNTPLYNASARGGDRVVQLLLDAGATVKARTLAGWTPLHVAADCGFGAVVWALLAAGADPQEQGGPSNWTPLHLAAKGQEVSSDIGSKRQYFRSGRKREMIEDLIEAGANVNAVTSEGWTPLHIAASNNFSYLTLEKLVKAGANTFARDKNGLTPADHSKQVYNGRDLTPWFAAVRRENPSSYRSQGCSSLVLIVVLVLICASLAVVVF